MVGAAKAAAARKSGRRERRFEVMRNGGHEDKNGQIVSRTRGHEGKFRTDAYADASLPDAEIHRFGWRVAAWGGG
jgi:hypothetical protein